MLPRYGVCFAPERTLRLETYAPSAGTCADDEQSRARRWPADGALAQPHSGRLYWRVIPGSETGQPRHALIWRGCGVALLTSTATASQGRLALALLGEYSPVVFPVRGRESNRKNPFSISATLFGSAPIALLAHHASF